MTFKELQQKYAGTSIDKKDWHQHKNGGGWVYKEAFIGDEPNIYIGPEAVVWSGAIRGGEIRGGEIRGGVIWGGVIRGGEIRGGVIRGGEIRGGVIRGGEIRGGEIWGGEIRGGEIWGGEIRGGVIRGGEIRGGVIWGGVIRGGVIWGGVIRGGVIRGGVIWGGVIRGGDWKNQPLFIQGSRHPLSNAKPGHLQIGCKCEPFAWWQTKEAELFATTNGYDEDARKEYAAYVELFIKFGK